MKAKDFRQEQDYPYNHFTKLTSTGISPDYDHIEQFAEEYHQSKVENLGLFSVSNSALLILEASKVLLNFDYTPTLNQEWLLTEKGKMTVLHRGKSKEELVNYVIEHYC